MRQSADDRRAIYPWEDFTGRSRGTGVQSVRIRRRRLPVPRNRRNIAGGRRGPGSFTSALGTGAFGQGVWLDMATRSARALTMLAPAGDQCQHDREHLRRSVTPDRPCRVRRIDQPPAAHPRNRPRGGPRPTDGGRLDRDQPQGAATGRCAAQRPRRTSDSAGLPRRRSPRSDAASPRAQSARMNPPSPRPPSPWERPWTGGKRAMAGALPRHPLPAGPRPSR